jgi:hypothetical protein
MIFTLYLIEIIFLLLEPLRLTSGDGDMRCWVSGAGRTAELSLGLLFGELEDRAAGIATRFSRISGDPRLASSSKPRNGDP